MLLAAWDYLNLKIIDSECFACNFYRLVLREILPFIRICYWVEKSILMTRVNFNYNEAIQAGNKKLIAYNLLCNAATGLRLLTERTIWLALIWVDISTSANVHKMSDCQVSSAYANCFISIYAIDTKRQTTAKNSINKSPQFVVKKDNNFYSFRLPWKWLRMLDEAESWIVLWTVFERLKLNFLILNQIFWFLNQTL